MSFVIDGAGHQPPGRTVAQIIEVAARIVEDGVLPQTTLDPAVKAYAFGFPAAKTTP